MIYWIQWNWRLEHRLADPPKSKCPKVFFIPSFLMFFFQTHKSHSLSRQPSNSPSPPPSLGDFHPQTAWQTLLALSTQDGFRQGKKKKKRGRKQSYLFIPYCILHNYPWNQRRWPLPALREGFSLPPGSEGHPTQAEPSRSWAHPPPQPSSYKMEYSYLVPREALPHRGGDTLDCGTPGEPSSPQASEAAQVSPLSSEGAQAPQLCPGSLPRAGGAVKGFRTNPPSAFCHLSAKFFSSGNDCLHTQVRGAEHCSPAALCFSTSGRPCSCQGGHLQPFSCHLTQNPTNCSYEEHFGRRFPAGVLIATANAFAQALWWYFSVAKVLLFEFPIALDEYLPN